MAPNTVVAVFFVGSLFFTSAATLQYLQTTGGKLRSWQPADLAWAAALIQLIGTLWFNVNTVAARLTGLDAQQENLRVWTPDYIGSVCFLVASLLAVKTPRARPPWRAGRPWRVAGLNLLGSVFFMAAAIAAYVLPDTGDLLDASVANSGTFLGALSASWSPPGSRSPPTNDGGHARACEHAVTGSTERTSMFQHSKNDGDDELAPTYGSRYVSEPIPKYRLPDGEMPSRLAYQIIHDELALDGNPALNLATFVTTWMEPEAETLMTESLNVNSIDQDEYPQTTEIQNRCVSMLADLFHADDAEHAMGTATVGSSEAIHLAGLAMKWRWRQPSAGGRQADRPTEPGDERDRAGRAGRSSSGTSTSSPAWCPITPERTVIDPELAMAQVDENTIGVVGDPRLHLHR